MTTTISFVENLHELSAKSSSRFTMRQNKLEKREIIPRANIFDIYAKVFRIMLSSWLRAINEDEREQRMKELDEIILPSNEEWRHRVYYRLVDLQREIDAVANDKVMEAETRKETQESIEWEWKPSERKYPPRPRSSKSENSSFLVTIAGIGGSMTEACIEPGWRIEDLILATKVLQKQHPPPVYADEAEMRRVFGLVYDVLRYKQILNRALEDVGFWYRHPECKDRERIVWLLLYDMQERKFARRGEANEVEAREKIFKAAGLKEVEDALLETKTRLAASVSRLRISGSALTLDELLPSHLRTVEGVVWGEAGAIASGWVNTMKVSSKDEFVREMTKLGLKLCVDCTEIELDEDTYVFDPLCPKVVNLHDRAREKLAKSELVRNHCFVFLERSLCLGAATLAQAIRCGHLCGPVVLTHSIAPRHTGYLAGLLADIDNAGRLLAFGTGESRCEYEAYLHSLGVTLQQCRVFSEKYVSSPPSSELERATIVLAVPSCSYTGIRNAVDLAVARGGDTSLLESLTSVDDDLKHSRVLLADQLTTLKYALTRPNVQLLIYEAHSVLPAETTEMIERVVQCANEMAVEKYIREHSLKKKMTKEVTGKGTRASKSGKRGHSLSEESKLQREERRSNYDDEDEVSIAVSTEVKIPESDLFELGRIADVCGEDSDKLLDKGCYLAVVKRKEMMQFNSLFMIKVAESKSLFGDLNKQQEPKEQRSLSPVRQNSQTSRKSFKRAKIQMDRIAAPTHSSMLRMLKQNQACPRHSQHIAQDERTMIAQAEPDMSAVLPSSLDSFPNVTVHPSRGPDKEIRNLQSRGGRLKTQEEQEENVRRLSTPTHASLNRMVNRKESDIIFHVDEAESFTSKQEIVIPEESKDQAHEVNPDRSIAGSFQNYTSTISTSIATEVDPFGLSNGRRAFRKEEVSKSSEKEDFDASSATSSSALRSIAVARATQNVLLENVVRETDKENFMHFPGLQVPLQRISRLHHPGGPPRFSRPLLGTRLETVVEHTQGFSYLFPGTGSTAVESGLDNP